MSEHHRGFVGNGVYEQVQPINITDADYKCIKLMYDLAPKAGETVGSQITKVTFEVDADGSDASKFHAQLKIYRRAETDDGSGAGTAAAADTYEFSADGSQDVANSNAYTVATIGAMLEKLNAIPGVTAHVLNAPIALSIDTDDFVDLAATVVPRSGSWLECVTCDASESETVYKRIGLPEAHHRAPFKLIGLDAYITAVAGSNVQIYTDDPVDGAGANYLTKAIATNATWEALLADDVLNAITVKGPIIVKASATAIDGLNMNVKIQAVPNM